MSEFMFCLIEGIFEEHAPPYTHWGYAEVPGSQWELILGDLAALRAALMEAADDRVVRTQAYPKEATILILSDWSVIPSLPENLAAHCRFSAFFAVRQALC
jgi:hypothetical protein